MEELVKAFAIQLQELANACMDSKARHVTNAFAILIVHHNMALAIQRQASANAWKASQEWIAEL